MQAPSDLQYTSMISQAIQALTQNNLPFAYQMLSKILQEYPNAAQPYYLMGMMMFQMQRIDESERFLRRGKKLEPDNVQILNGLASVLQTQNKLDEAVRLYSRAVLLKPDFDSAYNNLGVIHKSSGRFKEAERCYQKAVDINPEFGDALNNLGFCQQEQGKIKAACDSFMRAHLSRQCRSNAYSNYLMALNYDESLHSADLTEAHRRWGRVFSEQDRWPARDINSRPKRIAYLSGDFRSHAVAYFIEPILKFHNSKYEIYCYYNNSSVDEVTARLRRSVAHWCDCGGMNDDELASRIAEDEIDVLIDLSGHTGKNRLEMMSRRAAPMQVTWLGYPATTGLAEMDYRITDSIADPMPNAGALCSERLLSVPGSFLCYSGLEEATCVSRNASNRPLIFGCFNNFSKVNRLVEKAWVALLRRLPSSKLLVKNTQFRCAETRSAFVRRFKEAGIKAERIECIGPVAGELEHLELYNRVDIALDTFPYNGTTTTFEALWMGIPVVTFAGDRHAARVGASILTELGLPELVGENSDDYIHIAEALANDSHRRLELHESLRKRLQLSSLCDGPAFTQKLELALEEAWQELGN